MTTEKVAMDSVALSRAERNVLFALLEHPYADPYWLGEYLGTRRYTTRVLQTLKRCGYAQGFAFSRSALALKRVWTITPEGVAALAKWRGEQSRMLASEYSFRRGRMAALVLAMDRVTRLRWWLKNLEGFNPPAVGRRNELLLKPLAPSASHTWQWKVLAWTEEIQVEGRIGKYAQRIGFSSGVMLSHRAEARWLSFLIHIDDANVPVSAHKPSFTRWLQLQKDARYWDEDGNLIFPSLAIIAETDYRQNEYVNLFREIVQPSHLVLPGIYVALDAQVKAARGNPAVPIWASPFAETLTGLLAEERGWIGNAPEPSWSHLCHRAQAKKSVCIVPQFTDSASGLRLENLAALALALGDTEHQLIRLIAAHPLLSTSEIAQLLNRQLSQVHNGLHQLVEMNLVEHKMVPDLEQMTVSASIEINARKLLRKRETKFYLVTERGERYLAAVDGFRTALVQYRKAKFWLPELTRRLTNQWSHTRLGNMLFLQLVRAARARSMEIEWLAESESRLYFSVNDKRYGALPDGRGVLRNGEMQLHFVVEIDTTRSSTEKLERKFSTYYASAVARIVSENPSETLRVLVITHSPERIVRLQQMARELEQAMDDTELPLRRVAPVLFTTFQMLVNTRDMLDRPIWTDMDGRRVYCFPQFEPMPLPPDTTRTGQVTYKS